MKQNSQTKAKKVISKSNQLYTLEVLLTSGLVTREFAKQNPKVSRTIQIRGDQTLDDLHDSIFMAFDRFDEHMYEFQFGKRPHAPDNRRYKRSMPFDVLFADESDDPDVADTSVTLGALGLRVRQTFFYWFDFGDDWWHKIKVVAIQDEVPKKSYPIVTKRVGASPPQYIEWDEEGE